MTQKRYPSDLSDAQWEILEPLIRTPMKNGGKPAEHPLREIVNALLYILRTGCAWRMLPRELPPKDAVYSHFRRWKKDGRLERINDALREALRLESGKEASPSAAVMDSKSVPTTEKGGPVGTMRASGSAAGSGTSQLIHLGCC
jgi:transposase